LSKLKHPTYPNYPKIYITTKTMPSFAIILCHYNTTSTKQLQILEKFLSETHQILGNG